MTRLAWTFVRSCGWPRACLLAGITAFATALLLVAISMAMLPPEPVEALFNLVAEPKLRVGTAFATGLLVLPLLLMLHQVVRMGTASRERRLAALRLAGATPGEVRRVGALEVGLPVTVGALAGPIVYALLRVLFGGHLPTSYEHRSIGIATGTEPAPLSLGSPVSNSPWALIPTSLTPQWWQIAAIVACVAGAGLMTGTVASRHLIASPLGVSRREPRPAPQPWGLLLIVLGLAPLAAGSGVFGVRLVIALQGRLGILLVLGGVLLGVLGVLSLAPWVAFRAGLRAARRTSDPATLIAAGHLISDPRPAGRAAAAVGAIGIVSGGAAVIEAAVFFGDASGGFRDPFFVMSFVLVGGALLLTLLVAASTLSVHAAESLVDRRRVLAGLAAAGTPISILRDALRREAMLTSLPLSLGGLLIGTVGAAVGGLLGGAVVGLEQRLILGVLLVCTQVAVTAALTWVAIRVAVGAVSPQLRLAAAPANLRTE